MDTPIIILLAVFGAAFGSFFNVLIDRLPKRRSIVFPSSHCSNCNTPIPFYYNIPILSFIILRGKCNSCGCQIHWHHLLVELVTPVLFVMLYLMYGIFSFMFLKYLILVSFLIPIFFIDLFDQLILHVTSIPLIVIGLLLSLFPYSNVGIINALISGGFVLGLMIGIAYLYSLTKKVEGLGGGDIWLMTALAVFFGVISTPFIIILASVIGLIYYVVFIRKKEQGFAFGPFLVVSSVIWIFLGERILDFIM